jgi:hypothetical protein
MTFQIFSDGSFWVERCAGLPTTDVVVRADCCFNRFRSLDGRYGLQIGIEGRALLRNCDGRMLAELPPGAEDAETDTQKTAFQEATYGQRGPRTVR